MSSRQQCQVRVLHERYQTNLTSVFGTEDARYTWLTKVVTVIEGEFDEKAGHAIWNVYVPAESH